VIELLKIIVIGCPGAGKSTFSRQFSKLTHIPLYYLDMLWHKKDKTNYTREEFDLKLNDILNKDRWVIDGNYLRTLELRIKECDTVFLLDYPLDVCLFGVRSRIGKEREDMSWIEEEFDEEFKQWIIDFSKDQLPQIYNLIKKYQNNKEIHIFYSRKQAQQYLENFK
jgi:hypothetical protein